MTIGEIKTQVLAVLQQSGSNVALESLVDVAFNQAKLDACLKHDFVKSQRTLYVAVSPGQRFKIADQPFALGSASTETDAVGARDYDGMIYGDGTYTWAWLTLSGLRPVELHTTFNLVSGRLWTTGDYEFFAQNALSQTLETIAGVRYLKLKFDFALSLAQTNCTWRNYDPIASIITADPLLIGGVRYKALKFASFRGADSSYPWKPMLFMNNLEYYSKQYSASRHDNVYNYSSPESTRDLVLLHEGDDYWIHSDAGTSDTVYDLRLNIQEFVAPYTSDDDTDFFTEYAHTYLFWHAIIVGNAMVGVFLPRQEGALDVPQAQLESSWAALLDWDNALVQSPVQDLI
jgi:hypothetical protein